ncbi:hypothetical protein C2S51_007083 [Perilla frutescens var. frutescens]|nr:hypothetical protein C2S51_007083 [Perilla frutescens var. frutescens]
MHEEAWLVGGDFNEILSDLEKEGGFVRARGQMNDFQEALDDCDLRDIIKNDMRFTWLNQRKGEDAIKEKLDRFVGNEA